MDIRSSIVKKNVIEMLFIKGGIILINFLLVPLTLKYVNQDTYGIWLALSSMVGWISFFDIGLGNGLKNKLAEALAHGDRPLGKKYVSTTYAMLSLIFIPMMIILLAVSPSIRWESLLKIETGDHQELLVAASIVISYFSLYFIFTTINTILLADQNPARGSLINLLQNTLSLATIFVLTKVTQGNLVLLCIALCACPLCVLILSNLFLFKGKYKDIAPSFKDIDFHLVPDLLKLSVLFFIIQIAGIVQYQMTSFLIIRNYGPSMVTSYNIAYKLFNAITMVWLIFITPLWSAVTDAIAKNDYSWVRTTVSRYLKLWILFALGAIAVLAISKPLYHIWVGDEVIIPLSLSFWVMLLNIIMMIGNIYVYTLNGASIVKVQTIACLISPAVFIGCFILLRNMGLGIESVIIASIIASFNGYLLAPVQYYRHFHKKTAN